MLFRGDALLLHPKPVGVAPRREKITTIYGIYLTDVNRKQKIFPITH